jgi:hypothetical protein
MEAETEKEIPEANDQALQTKYNVTRLLETETQSKG